ncbi:MAPEG family protein [Albimonas sp. CAU 1670]|uniref:MAPEG family protein n=1 Tax=Albimonas sp. CAU 1670 TaxID=3032599 RepID=UPI0023DB0E2D|nr:MAPEG family protein [Albimonas sp. CAU 1670]MDF2231019.1 MAPEG family protein [Albimonas sp. CAU 1670]
MSETVPLGGPEIVVLALGGLLLFAQFVLMAIPANLQLGPDKTMGPRDEPLELHGKAGRLQRALSNMHESLLFYGVAAVSVTLLGAASPLTAACAWIWLAARVLYVPAYAFGWTPGRSLIFAVGNGAALIMILVALLG